MRPVPDEPRWLVTGAGGALGSVVLCALSRRGYGAVGVVSPRGPRPEVGATVALDLTELSRVSALLDADPPTHVIHAAAMASPADVYADPAGAQRVNVEASAHLAREAARIGARVVLVSTDMVFDGEHAPYDEAAEPAPVNRYGRTKVEAEARVLAAGGVVVRSPLLYGMPAAPRETTFTRLVGALRTGTPLRLWTDEHRTPLCLNDAADAVLRVADSDLAGIVHVGGPERLSRLDMGLRVASALGIRDPAIEPASQGEATGPEPRPRDLSLSSDRFTARFGRPPGRPMVEALTDMLR